MTEPQADMESGLEFQDGWRACSKCGGLFFTRRRNTPTCKKGGEHAFEGNTNRGVPFVRYRPGIGLGDSRYQEAFWRFCRNCHGLFHVRGDAEASDYGTCNHAKTGTAHVVEGDMYIVQFIEGSPAAADRATAFFKCSKCAAMYHPWSSGTACNAGGEHTPFGDKYYMLEAA